MQRTRGGMRVSCGCENQAPCERCCPHGLDIGPLLHGWTCPSLAWIPTSPKMHIPVAWRIQNDNDQTRGTMTRASLQMSDTLALPLYEPSVIPARTSDMARHEAEIPWIPCNICSALVSGMSVATQLWRHHCDYFRRK
jgi:hypothetical protein